VKRNFWEKSYCEKELLGKMVLRKRTFRKKKCDKQIGNSVSLPYTEQRYLRNIEKIK
jgi:hypothetical protein